MVGPLSPASRDSSVNLSVRGLKEMACAALAEAKRLFVDRRSHAVGPTQHAAFAPKLV